MDAPAEFGVKERLTEQSVGCLCPVPHLADKRWKLFGIGPVIAVEPNHICHLSPALAKKVGQRGINGVATKRGRRRNNQCILVDRLVCTNRTKTPDAAT